MKNKHLNALARVQGGYTATPNVILDAGQKYVTTSVYSYLLRFRNNKTGQCNPSQETVAKKMGVSKSLVEREIRKLKQLGWIQVKRTRSSCWYIFPHLDSSPMTNLKARDPSYEPLGFSTYDGSDPLQETDKQSEVNKNIEQGFLLHDGRECRNIDGTIMIHIQGNRWDRYDGKSDDLFSLGELKGTRAKMKFLGLDNNKN